MFELDHILVCAKVNAPEADVLVEAGFQEGPPNRHLGQGTACRRFFFQNAYLELLWLEDEAAASSPAIMRTGLAQRADDESRASRIGICLRSPGGTLPTLGTWDYRPPYLPRGHSIPMAQGSDRIEEPLLFFLPPAFSGMRRPDVLHPNGARVVTKVVLRLNRDLRKSPTLKWLGDSGIADIVFGQSEQLTLTLDDGRAGTTVTIPALAPVDVSW